MKNKYTVLTYCIVSMLFFSGLMHAQQIQDIGQLQTQMHKPTWSFEEIQKSANEYFISIRTNADTTMSKNEKQYRRWEYLNHGRSSYLGCLKGGSFTGRESYISTKTFFRYNRN